MKSEELQQQVSAIGEKAVKELKRLLGKNKIETLNITPYITERSVTGYTYLSVDKDGYGLGSQADTLSYDKKRDEVTVTMTSDDDSEMEVGTDELTDIEKIYLLATVEQIISLHEEDGEPLLKAGEDFEDYEED